MTRRVEGDAEGRGRPQVLAELGGELQVDGAISSVRRGHVALQAVLVNLQEGYHVSEVLHEEANEAVQKGEEEGDEIHGFHARKLRDRAEVLRRLRAREEECLSSVPRGERGEVGEAEWQGG